MKIHFAPIRIFIFSKMCRSHPYDFPIYRKSETTDNDQKNRCNINNYIICILAETVPAEQVDSCITEGGYGMKNTVPDSLYAKLRNEYESIPDGTKSLQTECHLQNLHRQLYKSRKGVQIVGTLNQHSVGQRNPASEQTQHDCCEGHDSKAAELNQKQQYNLSESGKSLSDIDSR